LDPSVDGRSGVPRQRRRTLSFNAQELRARYTADPEAVAQFFTAADLGVSAKLNTLLEDLGGAGNSLMAQRLRTLNNKIDQNRERIAFLEERLDVQRERLLLQFYRMEAAVGKLRSSLSALDAIQPLTPLTSSK